MTTSISDAIRTTVTVSSSVAQVWELAASPGWWLVDLDAAKMLPPADDTSEGSVHPFDDAFEITVLDVQPMETVTFEWAWTREPARPRTQVQVNVVPAGDGAKITVTEKGLSTGEDAELLAEHYRENEEGWKDQLELLKDVAEGRE